VRRHLRAEPLRAFLHSFLVVITLLFLQLPTAVQDSTSFQPTAVCRLNTRGKKRRRKWRRRKRKRGKEKEKDDEEDAKEEDEKEEEAICSRSSISADMCWAQAVVKSLVSHWTLQPLALYFLFPAFQVAGSAGWRLMNDNDDLNTHARDAQARGSQLHGPLEGLASDVVQPRSACRVSAAAAPLTGPAALWAQLLCCQLSECLLFFVTHRSGRRSLSRYGCDASCCDVAVDAAGSPVVTAPAGYYTRPLCIDSTSGCECRCLVYLSL
jgi:hypothetical protein